jgi:O-antigen/teichoic acid export membrane protein
MVRKVSKKDLLFGYASNIISLLSNLIIIPYIIINLSTSEVGLWFLLNALTGVVLLMDFGLQQTISRNISYLFSGSENVLHSGIDYSKNKKNINWTKISELYNTSKEFYSKYCILIYVVFMIMAALYIYINNIQDKSIYILLSILLITQIITLYNGFLSAILIGSGEIYKNSLSVIFNKVIVIALSIFFLKMNFGILGLAAAYMIGSLIGLIISSIVKREIIEKINENKNTIKYSNLLLKKLLHNSSKLGFVQIGSYLLIKGNLLVSGYYLSLEESAQYALTVTIFMTLNTFAHLILSIYLPRINYLQSIFDKCSIVNIYSRVILTSNIIYIMGAATILIFGENILLFIGSKTSLVEYNILIIYAIVMILELNHTIACTFITTENSVPFVKSSLISGAATIVISLVFINNYGVIALILSQGFVQILYNNWKWPHIASKKLNTNYFSLIKNGYKNIITG